MPYKCEDQLRKKAETVIRNLLESGIPVEPHPTMFRDYTVKLMVVGNGYINIYYSPNKDTFSLKLHELRDKSLAAAIEACWYKKPVTEQTIQCEYQAYVDGSYIDGAVGYGVVILQQSQEVCRFAEFVSNNVDMHQVAGELEATMRVIDWCQKNHIEEIEIFYDYEGIEKWATGKWRANKTAIQAYQAFMQQTPVQVTWQKVKSHTGNQWNEIADTLAKQGAHFQSPANGLDDPVAALERKAMDFVRYLMDQKISATYMQVYNDQFARISVQGGYFDLYNTRKRPMSPYLHNFKDARLQMEIERHWQAFQLNIRASEPESASTGFDEVEYYLAIFQPYRHLAFDFSTLANALKPFCQSETLLPTDNYDELEHIYQRVRKQQ